MAVMVNIHEAKTNLSKLLAKMSAGEEIIIARDGMPVARLVPFTGKRQPRKLGHAAGDIWIAPDFNDSLPDDFLAELEK